MKSKIIVASLVGSNLIFSACSQGINQSVTIDNGKQTELISKLLDKVLPPSPSASHASATPQISSSPTSAISTTVPMARPTVSPQPGEPIVLKESDFDIFLTGIPKPEEVRNYTPAQIELATRKWTQRYIDNKSKAYEILKMYFDALLMLSGKSSLGLSLIPVLLTKNTPRAEFNNSALFGAYEKRDEKDLVKYYANAGFDNTTNAVYYTDFPNRKLLVADGKPDYALEKPILIEDPAINDPENPVEGEIHEFKVMRKTDTYSALGETITLVFEFGGWKVEAIKSNIF